MKTECDKNGLEYELLMQEATKERFLRQIKPNMMPFEALSKNLVIIKKKREDKVDSSESPKLAAPAPARLQEESPKLAAPAPTSSFNLPQFNLPHIDLPQINLAEPIDFSALSRLESPSVVINMRDMGHRLGSALTSTMAPVTLPSNIQLPSLPPFPRLQLPNFENGGLITQPEHLQNF